MERMNFDSMGKLLTVDSKLVDIKPEEEKVRRVRGDLKTSESLDFLKEDRKIENVLDTSFWSLYNDGKRMEPLKFSNGKTQEDVVKEIVDLIRSGKKVIFLHGVCGTGKSAIALNVARILGKTSIVVPIKSLQRQYEEDYMGKTYLLKPNGKKMKIAMITGRDNHDSIYEPGVSCADPFLPDTIKLIEKNYNKLKEYYRENPFITNNVVPSIKHLKRISVAPANPYWSPILPAEIEINHLKDSTKKKYMGINGREFIFYHRKPGCSYYDQYLSYMDSDVIIFNSAKYLSEFSFGRKPATEVEIIDEADEFLDSLSNQIEINLTRLFAAFKLLVVDSDKAQESIDKIVKLITLEETRARAVGVDENAVHHINDTDIREILDLIISDTELQAEISIDEMNYSNTALEAARGFKESLEDTYLTYRKEEDTLRAVLVTTNLSQKFNQIVDGNKALVLMSGTLHSESVLKNVFGIDDIEIVEAETMNQGSIEIFRTGKEFDCRYSNFKDGGFTREDYMHTLSLILAKAARPTLVQVNAFLDLAKNDEVLRFSNIMSSDKLKDMQKKDKTGKLVSMFKSGMNDVLFTTKCSRGIDFPGDTCRSVVFTKYPNPNVRDTFWKILQKTHPEYFWEFYKDKARREFLQRLYRAVRSRDDHVFVLSPDLRVLNAVQDLQRNGK